MDDQKNPEDQASLLNSSSAEQSTDQGDQNSPAEETEVQPAPPSEEQRNAAEAPQIQTGDSQFSGQDDIPAPAEGDAGGEASLDQEPVSQPGGSSETEALSPSAEDEPEQTDVQGELSEEENLSPAPAGDAEDRPVSDGNPRMILEECDKAQDEENASPVDASGIDPPPEEPLHGNDSGEGSGDDIPEGAEELLTESMHKLDDLIERIKGKIQDSSPVQD